jgi:cytochrome c-type biogenesis protein CcmF
MAPLLFLMAVGPLARWKQAELPPLVQRLRWAAAVAVAAAVLSTWAAGRIGWQAVLGFAAAYWILGAIVVDALPRGASWAERWQRLRQRPRAEWGMWLAHAGVAVFIIGVVMVKNYEEERDVRVQPGDTVSFASVNFRFLGVQDVQGPNYVAARATVEARRGERLLATLQPEKRIYRVQQNPMTEAAIATGLTGDLYVALGESLDDGSWTLRVYLKPFVDWIWGGCLLMALGGVLAATDRRYRQALKQRRAAAALAEGVAA